MRSDERRRHVRIRPLPELPAKATIALGEKVAVELFDVSIGGLGFLSAGPFLEASRDQLLPVELDLGRYGTFELRVIVRHVGASTTGTEIDSPAPTLTTALGRYIAELLERGAPS